MNRDIAVSEAEPPESNLIITNMTRAYYISLPYATFAIVAEDDIITITPPTGRWAKDIPHKSLKAFLEAVITFNGTYEEMK